MSCALAWGHLSMGIVCLHSLLLEWQSEKVSSVSSEYSKNIWMQIPPPWWGSLQNTQFLCLPTRYTPNLKGTMYPGALSQCESNKYKNALNKIVSSGMLLPWIITLCQKNLEERGRKMVESKYTFPSLLRSQIEQKGKQNFPWSFSEIFYFNRKKVSQDCFSTCKG